MSNGAQCCAIEVCCNRAQAMDTLTKALGEREYVEKLYAFMDREGVIFAPVSARSFIDDIARMARKHGKPE